jgi:hypothetical protein
MVIALWFYSPAYITNLVFSWAVLLLCLFYAVVFPVMVRLLWTHHMEYPALSLWSYRGMQFLLLGLTVLCLAGAWAMGQHLGLCA